MIKKNPTTPNLPKSIKPSLLHWLTIKKTYIQEQKKKYPSSG